MPKDDTVEVNWASIGGKSCLKFQFKSGLSAGAAAAAIEIWRKAFQEKNDEEIVMVWACQDMKAYESSARIMWTKALKDLKPQISQIWLITNSSVISMGASMMGIFTGLDIKTVKSEAKIVL